MKKTVSICITLLILIISAYSQLSCREMFDCGDCSDISVVYPIIEIEGQVTANPEADETFYTCLSLTREYSTQASSGMFFPDENGYFYIQSQDFYGDTQEEPDYIDDVILICEIIYTNDSNSYMPNPFLYPALWRYISEEMISNEYSYYLHLEKNESYSSTYSGLIYSQKDIIFELDRVENQELE